MVNRMFTVVHCGFPWDLTLDPKVPVAVVWFNRGCVYRFWRFPCKPADIHAGNLGKTQELVVISVGSFRATTVPTGFRGNYHCFQGSRWGFP